MNWDSFSRCGLICAQAHKDLIVPDTNVESVAQVWLAFAESVYLLTTWIKAQLTKHAIVKSIYPIFYSDDGF